MTLRGSDIMRLASSMRAKVPIKLASAEYIEISHEAACIMSAGLMSASVLEIFVMS